MKTLQIPREMLRLYGEHKIPRNAAALSYYLTMTAFPLIICLYSLLGNNYAKALQIIEFLDQFVSAETTRTLKSFIVYVSMSHNTAMFFAGLTVLLTSASAAVRALQGTIGEMQGGGRFQGLRDFLFSLIFCLAFLASLYGWLPFIDISSSWQWVRFLLLGGITLVIFCGIYVVSKRRCDRYRILPGAAFATAGMVVMSWIFSGFIAASTRYPLVYGSLASLILLMFWLFLCCQVIYLGAALNIALRNVWFHEEDEA